MDETSPPVFFAVLAGFVGGIPRRPLLPLAEAEVAALRAFLTGEGLLS